MLKLGDTSAEKRIASKIVSDVFPNSNFSKRKRTYQNVSKALSFHLSDKNDMKLDVNSEIQTLKDKIRKSGDLISAWQQELQTFYGQHDIEMHQLRATLQMYDNEVEKFMDLHDSLDQLYEKEIKTLITKSEGPNLPQSVRDKLNDEVSFLSKCVNLGLRNTEEQLSFFLKDENLDSLRSDFQRHCPTLFDTMRTLFTVEGEAQTRKKELSFVHALCILINLQNKDLNNDIKMCFSLLLKSFGVGCRLMNILCKMSITYSWDALGNFLDCYIEAKLNNAKRIGKNEIPLMFLIDNINVYQGKKIPLVI